MQKEDPIVTFSHVVKKIGAEGFTWKKIPVQAVSEKKIRASPHHFSNGPFLIFVATYTIHKWIDEEISCTRNFP